MPSQGSNSKTYYLQTTGVDVTLEEIFLFGVAQNARHLAIPPNVKVTFKHEMSNPPFMWQQGLGAGTHAFTINFGWNKFKVRLESNFSTKVTWILS